MTIALATTATYVAQGVNEQVENSLKCSIPRRLVPQPRRRKYFPSKTAIFPPETRLAPIDVNRLSRLLLRRRRRGLLTTFFAHTPERPVRWLEFYPPCPLPQGNLLATAKSPVSRPALRSPKLFILRSAPLPRRAEACSACL
jgi:hypothetical protein